MNPSLQEQLSYLTRIVNPDYIIIVQHKADENMNFSNLKLVIPESRQKYKPQKRYSIKVIEGDDEGMKRILVEDLYSNNRIIYEGTCKEEHLQDNLDVVSRLYKGSSIEDKI